MAFLRNFAAKHNMAVDINLAQRGTTEYQGIFAYLARSRIRFVITHNPVLYQDYLQQFWQTAQLHIGGAHPVIRAVVHGHNIEFTAGDLRNILHLGEVAEENGPTKYDQALIHGCFVRMGYVNPLDVHPFLKNGFRGKWRYLSYILLVSLSNRRSGFDAINLQVASQMVALVLNKPYSFSQYFFDTLREQIGAVGAQRFLIYPRFVMAIINHFIPNLPLLQATYLLDTISKRTYTDMLKNHGEAEVPANAVNPSLFGHLINPNYEAPPGDGWEDVVPADATAAENVLLPSCEPVQQPYPPLLLDELVESESVLQTNPSNQKTSLSDHDPSFPVASTSYHPCDPKYSMDKFGYGPNPPIPEEATENALSLFDSSCQSPLPTPQATSSQPLLPAVPSASSAEPSSPPQHDSNEATVPPVTSSAPAAEHSSPPRADLDELPVLKEIVCELARIGAWNRGTTHLLLASISGICALCSVP